MTAAAGSTTGGRISGARGGPGPPTAAGCDTEAMQSAFGIVVFVVCGVGIVGALLGLIFNAVPGSPTGRRPPAAGIRPARRGATDRGSTAERDLEIRQMLEARNARAAAAASPRSTSKPSSRG